MPLKLCAVTGSRADWGLISPVLQLLRDDPDFTLRLVATGQHLAGGADRTDRTIEEAGFSIGHRIEMGLSDGHDDPLALTRALGREIAGFAPVMDSEKPDFLMIAGDRYEALGAVQAALLARIPVIHMYGGDITEGAIDDLIRHAITKLSHLHFVTNKESARRVIQMGEDPARVHCVGSPALDHIHRVAHLERHDFFRKLSFAPRAITGLVTFHPVTQESDSLGQCEELLAALDSFGPEAGWILTGSNADPEGQTLTRRLQDFAKTRENVCFIYSMGTDLYLNALRHANVVVGNSSSGLYEAPSFGTPTVNIGTRQKGRLKAACVLDCPPARDAIVTAIRKALPLKDGVYENPYGDGHSAERIISHLKTLKNQNHLCKKVFYDL